MMDRGAVGLDAARGLVDGALAALHRRAEAMAAEIRARDPRLEVSVAMDAQGATLRVGGPGLVELAHGSSRRAPDGLEALLAPEGDAVGGIVAAALEAA